MSSLKQESSPQDTSPTMTPFDIDQYINFDGAVAGSPSNASKALPTPSPNTIVSSTRPQQSLHHQQQQQTFSGPSHQYEQYKQQTGLPVGALANTFALNQPAVSPFGFGPAYGMIPPSDGYFGMNNVEPDLIDFGAVPEQNFSADVDMDFSMTDSTFINPGSIQAASPQAQTSHPARVWPGMHQQQAAQAKAQQQAAQEAAVAAQQHQRSASTSSRPASVANDRESDEVVEESISRLLNRMRNSSVVSSNGDDGATPTANGTSHGGRSRKDEEDMDEDERLLASEEGKKLSSKERRQLRNKVSARAFRSRRKEYIGQLEGELAAKAAEADEHKAKNEELVAENKRLTDLTRLLLSSSAFSDFLNELSGTGVTASAIQEMSQAPPQSQSQSQSQKQRKDANPNQYRSHSSQNSTIGMAMIPEESSQPSNAGDSTAYGYQNSNVNTGLFNAQVYAVTSIPEANFTSFECATLSKKSCESIQFETKDAPAPIEHVIPSFAHAKDIPAPIETYEDEGDDDMFEIIDESDPTLALYADHPASPAATEVAPEDCIFGAIPMEKALEHLELVIVPHHTSSSSSNEDSGNGDDNAAAAAAEVSTATLERFQLLCCSIESSVVRVANLTAHLH